MKIYDKNLKAHKITNTFYLIIIIPFLLLALFSATVMFNSKKAGGYANIFGYYVIELENNNFYNSETGEYKSGTKQMFKATSYENLKSGDIVVYYSTNASKTINAEASDWISTANVAMTSAFSDTTDTISPVKVVKIGPYKKIAKDSLNNEYTLFGYYESENGDLIEDVNKLILGDDIIGVAVPTNATLASILDYAKTTESLLLLVLLPCALLLLIKFMSLSFYKKYENNTSGTREGKVVTDEQISYAQALNANRARNGAPQRAQKSQNIPNPNVSGRPIPKPPSRKTPNPTTNTTSTTTNASKNSLRTPPARPPAPPKRPTRKI